MKKRVSAILLALVLVFGLLPATVFAAGGMGTAVYVRSDGNDTTGDGSADKPYATLAKAVDAANDGATVYVMSDLTMTECARFYSKSLTITSLGDATYTITRGDNFAQQQDNARSTYNPAMVEVQTTSDVGAGLTLTNIIFDDARKHEGTVFAQASSGKSEGDESNKIYVQDAIIASNATVPSTITLGEGAVLQNFGGMSAVRVTDQAKLVMKSGSVIKDASSITRSKGDAGSVGPAGAVWLQGGSFEMKAGAAIQNINGSAVYADGGSVSVGGTISGITDNTDMWQSRNGCAIHLRGENASAVLTSTSVVENISGGGSAVLTIPCTREGRHVYTLRQEAGQRHSGQYDDRVYYIAITVTPEGRTAAVYGDAGMQGGKYDVLEFRNRYRGGRSPGDAPAVSPKTGDGGMAVYAALALVSAAGMAVTAGQKRDF